MGVVYQGKHIVVGRKVAIKFLSSEFSTQEDIVTRFYREAQTAAAIGHKNIIDILDVGISDRHEPYFVMEYLEGECLSSLLDRIGPLDLGAALGIVEPLLLAISAAHAKGIVHRDLKPDNIFLVHDATDDSISVKLIDFGISKLIHVAESDKLTRAGSALGTPCYMSPEQASCAKDIDHRSDVYSMGVILFEMLTGRPPYEGENNQETMMKILTEASPDPRAIYPDFPEVALPIIERAMKRDPGDRYPDAAAMLDAVRQLAAFHDRQARLSEHALGIANRQCAVGDLGREIGSDESIEVPARVLKNLSERLTPKSWTATKGKVSRFPAPGSRVAWMLVSLTLILIGVVVFFIVRQEKRSVIGESVVKIRTATEQRKPEAVPGAASTAHTEVRIAVTGTPPRSTILFGDVVVPSDKFFVPAGTRAVPLVVEAPGYAPFRTEITPDRDVTIAVEMPRLERKKSVADQTGDEAGAAASGTPTRRTHTGKYIKGRRKTEIVRDFE